MRGFIRAFARSYSGMAAMASMAIFALLSLLGPAVWGSRATETDMALMSMGPSPQHPLGTDQLGRDILARTLAATRISLGMALAAAAVAAVIGLTMGTVILLLPQRWRNAGLRMIDVMLSFPGILLALVVTAIVGPGVYGAVLAIGIALAPSFARLTNNLAASVAGRDYILSARGIGLSPLRILVRYILPNIAGPLVTSLFQTVAVGLVAVSSLSFLGLGLQPPAFDWGRMLTEGVRAIYVTPVAALAPAGAVTVAGLSLNMLGEAIARALNPLLWSPLGKVKAGEPAFSGQSTPPSRGSRLQVEQTKALLRVEDLKVQLPSARGAVTAVNGVTFDLAPGEILGIVGESGSGKSMTALAVSQLLPASAQLSATRLDLRGESLLGVQSKQLDRFLGKELALIFQDPMSSLNPALRIGVQLSEGAQVHQALRPAAALARAIDRMKAVQIPAPEARVHQYPHEFSGGMRQRAMIAMSLMNEPSLIIADEPTTALDVTVQAQIIDLLKQVNRERGTAIILISHDMNVIAELCHRVLVMYAGQVVEEAPSEQLLRKPLHPYTQALIRSLPDMTMDRGEQLEAIPGRAPDLSAVTAGCPFADRCPEAMDRCRTERPALVEIIPGSKVACWAVTEGAERRESYA